MKSGDTASADTASAAGDNDDCGKVIFSPPLYRQRYDLAASILRESEVASVRLDSF